MIGQVVMAQHAWQSAQQCHPRLQAATEGACRGQRAQGQVAIAPAPSWAEQQGMGRGAGLAQHQASPRAQGPVVSPHPTYAGGCDRRDLGRAAAPGAGRHRVGEQRGGPGARLGGGLAQLPACSPCAGPRAGPLRTR